MSKRGYSSRYQPQERAYYTRARTAVIRSGIELCCARCGAYERIEIHHKDQDISNNLIENLQPLCRQCHIDLHNGTAV